VQASLSKTALDDFAIAGKSTWEDITKSAKKGLLKVSILKRTLLSSLDLCEYLLATTKLLYNLSVS
jgi:hypothetical protein